MKFFSKRVFRTSIIVCSCILILVIAVILLISPITKYLIEKYDVKYTGRQIKMDWVYVNPFTGYVHFSNLKIYESRTNSNVKESDSIFFSAKGLSAKFALHKLLSKTIEITELVVNEPKGIIIQSNKDFNFNDLIKKFTPAKSDSTPSSVHFSILSLKILNGEFYYRETIFPINYFIREVNIESTGIQWNSDTIGTKFSFLSGTGTGSANGNLTINFKTLDYRFATSIENFDLSFIEQYLKDLANYGKFRAKLDADIKATGKLDNQEDVDSKGRIVINDFHFGKNLDNDYASFDKLIYVMDELSPKNHIYLLDSIILSHPYFKYEIYDYLDNIQRMFGKNEEHILKTESKPTHFNLILKIADYIVDLSKNFFISDYKINKLAISKGCLKFNDYSLTEKFSLELDPLYIHADSVNKNHKRVNIDFNSNIRPYGTTSINLSINPKDSGDFDMQYHLQKLPVAMFNPYLISFTSFPFDRGTIELNGMWKVRKSIINSQNHFLVIDPRVTKRLKNKDTKWLPDNLIMFFLREQGNVIDYEIPITGDLKSPRFHLKDVILDILGNIFVKPVTTPYRMEVKSEENEIEKFLTLKWDMRQASLLPAQESFLHKLANFLLKNPESTLSVYPIQYDEKEKEYIQFFEAKKKYFLLIKGKNDQRLSKDDSLEINEMSVKDAKFVKYLDELPGDSLLFTIQAKCSKFIGSDIVNARFKELCKEREAAFILQFKLKAVENRVIFNAGENTVPYNGFSFYRLSYKGELPKYLISAFEQMNRFNNEAPRKRFKKEREKDKVFSNM
jgi:Domain of Unknown Function (DUF748)